MKLIISNANNVCFKEFTNFLDNNLYKCCIKYVIVKNNNLEIKLKKINVNDIINKSFYEKILHNNIFYLYDSENKYYYDVTKE